MDYKEMKKMIKTISEEPKMLQDALIAENEEWEENFQTQDERNRWAEFWNGLENEVDETRDVLSMTLLELIEKDEKVVPYAKAIASIFNSKKKEVSEVGKNKNAVQSENKGNENEGGNGEKSLLDLLIDAGLIVLAGKVEKKKTKTLEEYLKELERNGF